MRRAISIALALCALPGCGQRFENHQTKLLDAYRSYNNSVRWQNWRAAAHWLPPAYRQAYLEEHLGSGSRSSVNITEYTVRDVDLPQEPGDRAYVVIERAWYRLPDMTVRRSIAYQSWHYVDRKWRLESETERDPRAAPQNGIGSSSKPSGSPPP